MTNNERIVHYTSKTMPKDTQTDWERVRALTDADIDRAIAEDPDAAPILDEDFFRTAEIVRSSPSKKRRITILVDEEVISFFQQAGKSGYQKRMHDVLKAFSKRGLTL